MVFCVYQSSVISFGFFWEVWSDNFLSFFFLFLPSCVPVFFFHLNKQMMWIFKIWADLWLSLLLLKSWHGILCWCIYMYFWMITSIFSWCMPLRSLVELKRVKAHNSYLNMLLKNLYVSVGPNTWKHWVINRTNAWSPAFPSNFAVVNKDTCCGRGLLLHRTSLSIVLKLHWAYSGKKGVTANLTITCCKCRPSVLSVSISIFIKKIKKKKRDPTKRSIEQIQGNITGLF